MRVLLASFIAVFMMSAPVQAQEDDSSFLPVFLKPFVDSIRNTFTSDKPTIVEAKQKEMQTNQLSQSKRDRLAGPGLVDNKDPWEGTSFGRIKREIDYFDPPTGQYYNQYDYMAVLAKRGDDARLNEVGKYLQNNGVFNPQKYQAALRGQSQAKQPVQGGGAMSSAGEVQATNAQRRVQVTPQSEDTFTPKRIHQGYDEDMEADPQAQPKAENSPIFLR